MLKSAHFGYTPTLIGALAHFVVRAPAPILVLMPTESDCRDFIISDIEPTFLDSQALRPHLPMPRPGRSDRNTLLHRLFAGGSLKIVAGKAPRNLRRHSAKILLIDEADAIEVSAEGDPITLAEKRTLSFDDRKIVVGSTHWTKRHRISAGCTRKAISAFGRCRASGSQPITNFIQSGNTFTLTAPANVKSGESLLSARSRASSRSTRCEARKSKRN